eukprot:11021-Heterococcus_DN1.PRE.2
MAFSLEALRLGNGTDPVKAALHGLDAAATQAWLGGLTTELAKANPEDFEFLIKTIGLLAQRCTHRENMELFLENSADYLRSALLELPEFFSKVQIKISAVQVRGLVLVIVVVQSLSCDTNCLELCSAPCDALYALTAAAAAMCLY